MKKIFANITIPIIIFTYIFNFKIPIVYSSSFLALLISFLNLNLAKILIDTYRIYKNKKYIQHIFMYLLLFCFSFFSLTIINSTYDYSFLENFYTPLFYILSTPLIISSIKSIDKSIDLTKLMLYVNIAFYAQSIIIITSFINAEFGNFIQEFQNEGQAEISSSYYGGGIRGLALSGGQFFNLSILFTINFIFLGYRIALRHNFKYESILIYILMFTSMTAGRTVILGIITMSLLPIIINYKTSNFNKSIKYIINLYLKLSFLTLFLVSILAALQPEIFTRVFSFSKFAFEFIYNFLENGKFSTASTDVLKTMFFVPDLHTIFFGDGFYTNIDQSYYGNTDSGYMRPILAVGIISIFIMIINLISSLSIWKNNSEKKLYLTIIATYLILNVKGESFLYTTSYTIFISIIICFNSVSLKNK